MPIELTERHMRVAGGAATRLLSRADGLPAVDFDDIRQECLMAIWARAVDRGRAPDPSLAWRIAIEAGVELLRRHRPRGRPRSVVLTLDRPDARPSRPALDSCLKIDLRDAVARLTPALRAAVRHRLRGMGPAEAAEAEGLSVRAMDSRRDRAFAALRRSLSAYNPLED